MERFKVLVPVLVSVEAENEQEAKNLAAADVEMALDSIESMTENEFMVVEENLAAVVS